MSNNLDNTSTEDIRSELDQIVSDTAEWLHRAAVLLVELRKRREKHPLMSSNTLRHFKLIADGKLDAAAALAVGGNRNLVRALSRLPFAEQLPYATQRTVQVVEHTADGREDLADRHITHLSQDALDRVFSEDGLRSIEEQREMIGKPPNRERVEGIIVDHDEKSIVVSRHHLRPRDLIKPLKALGYELRRIGA